MAQQKWTEYFTFDRFSIRNNDYLEQIDQEAWVDMAHHLKGIELGVEWAWGDLIVLAEMLDADTKTNMKSQLVQICLQNTNRDEKTVENWVTTCRVWPKTDRILSITHHLYLNPVKDVDTRYKLLNMALDQKLSTRALREVRNEMVPELVSKNTGGIKPQNSIELEHEITQTQYENGELKERNQTLNDENIALREQLDRLTRKLTDNGIDVPLSPVNPSSGFDDSNSTAMNDWERAWGDSDKNELKEADEWIRKYAPPYVKKVWAEMKVVDLS